MDFTWSKSVYTYDRDELIESESSQGKKTAYSKP